MPPLTQPLINKATASGEFSVQRGKPKNSSAIAELITRLSKGKRKMTSSDVMESFGDKAYMLLQMDGNWLVWQAGRSKTW
jgi:hypothetical protein